MGKRALVLGGTGYVGSSVVRGLAAAGVPTAFTFHQSAANARALADELGQRAYRLDLADSAQVCSVLDQIRAAHGAPDVLINCAACAHSGRLDAIDEDTWNQVMNVNVRGIFTAIRALAPTLRENGGDIVLMSGPDAVGAAPSAIHFAASQTALVGLMRGLASELGPHGVRINVLTVGVLAGGAGQLLPPERLAAAERYSALGRLGTADEAARAALWLALENPYLNGAVIPVTGGL